jgi:adenosine deaminase
MSDLAQQQEAFLHALRHVELHVHIEGAMTPDLLFKIADRNGMKMEHDLFDWSKDSDGSEKATYKEYTDLNQFLNVYTKATEVLKTREDFKDLAYEYMCKAHSQGVMHAEIFIDVQTYVDRGVHGDEVVHGLEDGFKQGQQEFGISYLMLGCALRHLSAEECIEGMEILRPYHESGHIHGMGLCSSEKDQPPTKFLPAFQRAKEIGFERFTAHAGEDGPASYVIEALDVLGVTRIDHGINGIKDEEVFARLRDDGIMVTLCPLSNIALNVIDHLNELPIRKMLDHDLKVSPRLPGSQTMLMRLFTVLHQLRRPSALQLVDIRKLPGDPKRACAEQV